MSSQYMPFDSGFGSDFDATSQNLKYQQSSALDFFSFTSPSDVLAPHPDLFESELDSISAGFDPLQLQLLTVDQSDAFTYLRSDTPTCGPPSTITVSSESFSARDFDTLSSFSESYYSYPNSNSSSNGYLTSNADSTHSFPFSVDKLDMDFNRACLQATDRYHALSRAQKTASGLSLDAVSRHSYGAATSPIINLNPGDDSDPDSFGPLPPPSPARHSSGSVYSDYASDYSSALGSFGGNASVNPASVSPQPQPQQTNLGPAVVGSMTGPGSRGHHPYLAPVPREARLAAASASLAQSQSRISVSAASPISNHHHSASLPSNISTNMSISSRGQSQAQVQEDPRRRYICNQCPRAFARAYNLKTHMATHDPNRPKPHVCPHRGCGRSFSRKHDLGRHLVSIHREDASVHGLSGIGLNASSSDGGKSGGSGVGVGLAGLKDARVWCERCGKSGTAGDDECSCEESDVK